MTLLKSIGLSLIATPFGVALFFLIAKAFIFWCEFSRWAGGGEIMSMNGLLIYMTPWVFCSITFVFFVYFQTKRFTI